MKELLAKLLDDDEDMLDLHLTAKAAEADARTSALQRISMDASRAAAADIAAVRRLVLPFTKCPMIRDASALQLQLAPRSASKCGAAGSCPWWPCAALSASGRSCRHPARACAPLHRSVRRFEASC